MSFGALIFEEVGRARTVRRGRLGGEPGLCASSPLHYPRIPLFLLFLIFIYLVPGQRKILEQSSQSTSHAGYTLRTAK